MKRLLALLLAALMLCTLCACTETKEKAPTPEPEPTTPEPEKTLPDGTMADPYGLGWNEPSASAMGTGEKTDAGAPGVLNVLYNFYTSSEERTNETGCTVSVTKIELTGMKNVLLKGQIEKDIQAMNDDLAARRPTPDLAARMAETGAASTQATYSISDSLNIVGNLLCVQGQGWYTVNYCDADGTALASDTTTAYAAALYYDLRDGHRMTLSELFAPDCDYMALLNAAVTARLSGAQDESEGDGYELTRPFAGLPADYPLIFVSDGSLEVELTDRCPYLGTLSPTGVPGTALYFELGDFWRQMPVLWGDASAGFEGAQTNAYAPEQYDLRFRSEQAALPDGSTAQLVRLSGGAPENAAAAIDAALQTLGQQALDWVAAQYKQLNPAAGSVWVGVLPSYNVVGPFLTVSYNLDIDGGTAAVHTELKSVFDLHSGAQVTLRTLLRDPEAAVAALTGEGRTEAQARALLDSTSFMVGSGLDLWGNDGAANYWTLEPAMTNRDLFAWEETK